MLVQVIDNADHRSHKAHTPAMLDAIGHAKKITDLIQIRDDLVEFLSLSDVCLRLLHIPVFIPAVQEVISDMDHIARFDTPWLREVAVLVLGDQRQYITADGGMMTEDHMHMRISRHLITHNTSTSPHIA